MALTYTPNQEVIRNESKIYQFVRNLVQAMAAASNLSILNNAQIKEHRFYNVFDLEKQDKDQVIITLAIQKDSLFNTDYSNDKRKARLFNTEFSLYFAMRNLPGNEDQLRKIEGEVKKMLIKNPTVFSHSMDGDTYKSNCMINRFFQSRILYESIDKRPIIQTLMMDIGFNIYI